jgi:predicted site-specific integrase-resolvase
MPNIASILKNEIARIGRKEVRAESEPLKIASAQYRSTIAGLKRQVADLERQVRQLAKGARRQSSAKVEFSEEKGDSIAGERKAFLKAGQMWLNHWADSSLWRA